MTGVREVDVVVIGAGPVGENVADRTTRGGLATVIVEAERAGGECLYWACMPSKALLRPGQAVRGAEGLDGVSGARLDRDAVLRRRDRFASHWDDSGQVEWLDGAGISLIRGHGSLIGERRVRVEDGDGTVTELVARHAVVAATGSVPVIADIPGLREAEPWTSREATSVRDVPGRTVILGGGVVATEAATFLADLGSDVTILSRSPLLGGFERFAGDAVREALVSRGVTVREDADVREVRRVDGEVRVSLAQGEVTADEVVVATGRIPRTADLGLDRVGLEPSGALEVDETMRVPAAPWLYATGDVNGRAPLTHQGKYQARVAGDAIAARARGEEPRQERWGHEAATADGVALPQVVFTDPEVAAVGLTADQAAERGLDVRVIDVDLGSVAGASLLREDYAGTARLVVDAARDIPVGATFVGPGVAELLHAATIAIVAEVPLERLWHAVPAYPTVSEVWLRLLEKAGL